MSDSKASQRERIFTCTHCGKVYKYQSVYNKHLRQCQQLEREKQ
jgi:uncharacterized C2H2 Zn-finger protein